MLPPAALETSGYPGARSQEHTVGLCFQWQHRPLSGYNPHAGLPMPPMTAMSQQVAIPSHQSGIPPQMAAPIHAIPQPLSAVPHTMTVPAWAPQQAPKAYTTNYTVPMELMKRDRSLATMSPMPSPHASPQVMRKAGVSSDRALVPIGGAVQAKMWVWLIRCSAGVLDLRSLSPLWHHQTQVNESPLPLPSSCSPFFLSSTPSSASAPNCLCQSERVWIIRL